MEDMIRQLDDETAARVLETVAKARMREGGFQTELTPGLREALAAEFEIEAAAGDVSSKDVSRGDVARAALLVLADDPQTRDAIRRIAVGPVTRDFGVVTGVALAAAALIALQTHVRFERDKEGKWSVVIEKKPTKDALLQPLVAKILACFGGGGGAGK